VSEAKSTVLDFLRGLWACGNRSKTVCSTAEEGGVQPPV